MVEKSVILFVELEPKDIISLYYDALYSGDLSLVKEVMTPESYNMTLETFGLRLSMRDSEFKDQLKEIEDNSFSLSEVERKLSKELLSRKLTRKIDIKAIIWNGLRRQTIEYTEDKKIKKLYFSKDENGWKINYYAGRKVD